MSESSRRDFLRTAALTSIGVWGASVAPAWANPKSPNERLAFACIGVGGKGESDTADAARFGDIVAICDVDENTLNKAAQKYPNAKKYTDYRKMYDEMGKSIDAVTVSTPDHSHGPAAAMGMHLKKHCYCQKPLTHSIYEARTLGELARKNKIATQMGNQGTGSNDLRKKAYLVRAGALGTVREVHVWTDRPIWPQGIDRGAPKSPPSNLDWNLWLGPAKERPYSDHYHTFEWRGWWDFGTGALGDMACHTVNMPYMALDLKYPTTVEAHSTGTNRDSYPKASRIRFEFPATAHRPAVTLFWYDGSNRPSPDLLPGTNFPISGSLIIGDKGKLYTPGDYGDGGKFIEGDRGILELSNIPYPETPGHWEEFIRAIRSSNPLDPKNRAMSNFPEYAGPLVETILLGNLAVWGEGKTIEWDAKRMQAKNAPEVAEIIRPVYRDGYHL